MPVYNGESFIRDALDSLLNQTYTNFQIVISDNGSTDQTEQICSEYVQRDSRIRYVRQPENKGAYHNFRFLLEDATEEYFMWAAADDRWLPQFLEKCLEALENDPSSSFAIPDTLIVSRFHSSLSFSAPAKLNFIESTDPKRRVAEYAKLEWGTHKDNIVYSLWRRETIAFTTSTLYKAGLLLLGGQVNEYILSFHKGSFIPEQLFQKTYRYIPPGHLLGKWLELPISRIRRLLGRKISTPQEIQERKESYLKTLREVLQLTEFDEAFIEEVVQLNEQYA